MNRWVWTFAVVSLFVFATGCSRRSNDQDAIRASIEQHLNGRADLNMNAMVHEFKQISVNGNQATAQVEFCLKQGGGSMLINYSLQRQGGKWTVLNSVPIGHPGVGQMPPGISQGGDQDTVPTFNNLLNGQKPSGKGALPPGHPPVHGSNPTGNSAGQANSPGKSY